MSNLDDFVSRADADAFQAALETGRSSSPDLARLLETVGQVSAISVPAPDPAFVAQLADRLHTEATASAAPVGHGPSVLRVRRAWPKALAGAAAGVIVATTGLGVASEHALPGDLLYGVRGVVDGLEVQLAGSDGEQGRTLLAQARRHIGDTETLSGRPEPEVDAVREALRGAAASVESGDAKLFLAFDSTRDPSHLVVVRDFTSWSEPALQQLRRVLPAAASGELASLESVVESGATELRAKLAACGDACKDVVAPRTPETASPPSASSPVVTPTSPSTVPPVTSSARSQPLPTHVVPPVVLPTTEPPAGPTPPWRTVPGQVPTSPPRVTVPATRVPDPPRPRPTRPPATATVPPPAPPTTTTAPKPTDPGPRPTATTVPTEAPPTPRPTHTHHCPPGYIRIGPYCIRMPQGPGQPTVTVIPVPPVEETTPAPGTTTPAPPSPTPKPTAPPSPTPKPTAPPSPAPKPTAPAPPTPDPAPSVPVSPAPTATSAPVLPSPAPTNSPAPEPAPTGVPTTPTSSAPAPAGSPVPEPEAPEPTAPPTATAPPTQPAPGLPSATSTPTDGPDPTDRPHPTGRPVPIEPVAPVFADQCLPGSRIVALPKVRGLSYSWTRAALGDVVEVTVRARPLPGHVLADGATSTWVRLYLDCGRP